MIGKHTDYIARSIALTIDGNLLESISLFAEADSWDNADRDVQKLRSALIDYIQKNELNQGIALFTFAENGRLWKLMTEEINFQPHYYQPSEDVYLEMNKSRPFLERDSSFIVRAWAPIHDRANKIVGFVQVSHDATNEFTGVLKNISVLSVFIILFVFLSLYPFSSFLARQISTPLEVMVEQTQKIKRGDWGIQFRDSKLAEIETLSSNISSMLLTLQSQQNELQRYAKGLEVKVRERTKEISESLIKTQAMLDVSGQGFVLVDREQICLPFFSSACLQKLSAEPTGQKVSSYFHFNDKDFDLWWETLFLDLIPFNDVALLGPKNQQYGETHLEFSYHPVRFKDRIELVLVSFVDVSLEVTLKNEKNDFLYFVNKVMSVLGNKQSFDFFVFDAREKIARLAEDSLSKKDQLFLLHTMKGNSLLFKLDRFAELCHEWEDEIGRGDKVDWSEVQRIFQYEVDEVYGFLKVDNLDSSELSISTKRLRDVLSAYEQVKVDEIISELKEIELGAFFCSYIDHVAIWAKAQSKVLNPLSIEGEDVHIDLNKYGAFLQSLIHVMRNALAHGVEDPDERLELGKSEAGTIRMSYRKDKVSNKVSISISDDGRGLVPGTRWQDLLHLDKKKEATLLSGRGVGLGAIDDELKKISGEVAIKSTQGLGTEFIFTF